MRFGIRELIFFIVLMAVPIASFLFVFKPRNELINTARQEIQLKQSRMDRLAAITSRLDDLGLAIANGRESIELIEQKLPNQEGVDDILEQVWQIAKRNRQIVKSVKGKKQVPAALYMELPLEMEMEGDFDGFYQFLLELENLPRITRVHQLNIERLDEKNEDGEIRPGIAKAKFTLSIYFENSTDSNDA
jgi:type IV pilus assembly protein PilO